MDQNTKKRLEVLGAILILLALIVAIAMVLSTQEKEGARVPGDLVTEPAPVDSTFVPSGPPEYLPQPVARGFAERFGSFSSESGFKNIEDVLPLASAELRTQLEALMRTSRQTAGGGYYGISTRVIAVDVVEEAEASATLSVKTQRSEATGSPGNAVVRYQDLVLGMIREGDTWLVNSFAWK